MTNFICSNHRDELNTRKFYVSEPGSSVIIVVWAHSLFGIIEHLQLPEGGWIFSPGYSFKWLHPDGWYIVEGLYKTAYTITPCAVDETDDRIEYGAQFTVYAKNWEELFRIAHLPIQGWIPWGTEFKVWNPQAGWIVQELPWRKRYEVTSWDDMAREAQR